MVLFVLLGAVLTAATEIPTEILISVHFINVGQGDAILIDYGEHELLIDGGRGSACSLYLSAYVDGALEGIVATHMDADHIGGLDDVFESFSVLNLWTNGNTATTDTYYDFRDAYTAEECSLHTANRGGTITLGDIELSVLHPQTLVSERNSNSVVLLLSFMGRAFLLTGDIDMDVEDELRELDLLPDIDVLKVAHHGSGESTSTQFLESTKPEICIVSTSGQYGHPHREALERIGRTVGDGWRWLFRTDEHGSIVISVDKLGGWYYRTTKDADPIVVEWVPPPPPPPPGGVVINEVEPNPAGDDSGNEWVELYNAGTEAVDIGDWQIVTRHGRTASVTVPYGTVIQPGQFLVFYRSKQWIDNKDEVVELRNASGGLVDSTCVLNDSSDCGTTWARVPDGSNNWVRQGGTKGYSND